MPRRRGLILVLFGLVLAIGAGALVFLLLQGVGPTPNPSNVQAPPTQIPVKRLPVAARLIAEGEIISDTDVTLQEFPIDTPATGAITDTTAIIGEQVIRPIQPGAIIRAENLLGAEGGALSSEITPDRVALAFSTADLLSQTRVITTGDHLDLLLTLGLTDGGTGEVRNGLSTNFTVQNINVLRVIRDQPTEENPNPAPSALIFELTPEDAVIVKFVKDSGGTIDFALRSPLDDEEFEVNTYNLDNLRDDFGFNPPQSNTTAPTQQ